MTKRKENVMAFRSKLPALVGEKQKRENRVISPVEIASETGLSKQTIYAWLRDNATFDTLDSDTASAFCVFFEATLNDIVDIVPNPRRGEGQ